MRACAVLMTLFLVAVSASYHNIDDHEEEHSSAHYDFGYAVKDPYTDTDYGQHESRNGDVTRGSYSVLLPDGRIQVVTYYVDPYSGFVADVKYIDVARYNVFLKPAHDILRPSTVD